MFLVQLHQLLIPSSAQPRVTVRISSLDHLYDLDLKVYPQRLCHLWQGIYRPALLNGRGSLW